MVSNAYPYNEIHYVHSLDRANEEDLRQIIRTFPVIDNHAHNILREEYAYGSQDFPFESITSEAQGHALHDHTHKSLAYIQGINHLADLLECDATRNDVKAFRYEWVRRDFPGLVKRCLEGTHALLIDDGLSPEVVNPVGWHQQFVPRVARIVRIESLAAELLEQLAGTAGLMRPGLDADWDKAETEAFLIRFNIQFKTQIRTLAQDPRVRGFKSVICYRTGLDVSLNSRNLFRPHQSLTESLLLSSFHDFLQRAVRTNNYRIEQKEVNDYLVVAACDVLHKLVDTDGEGLPFQFHTGFGDSDIDLVKANPAHMKALITAFPNVDFVMLHASYPYTREAGYLASVFANVWLDIGLIFPLLSRDGQESGLRHTLQLTPTSKILWSTDGHFHPETYYLANRQFRSVLEKVFLEFTRAGDITIAQAITASVDILFWNSNQLYNLDEESKYPQLLRACGRSSRTSSQTLRTNASLAGSFDSGTTTVTATRSLTLRNPSPQLHSSAPTIHSVDTMAPSSNDNVAAFDDFREKNPSVKYIWVENIDFTGGTRQRMIPVAAFRKHLSTGRYPGITTALPRLLQNDTQAPGTPPTGEFKMVPDMSSLTLNTTIQSPSATVQTWWMDDVDGDIGDHYFACPRWALAKQVEALQQEYGLTMLMGAEVEIIFMRPIQSEDKSDLIDFEPLNMVHCWSNISHQDVNVLPMIEEIVESLAKVGIELDQFHAEAAPGQWEFPLPAHEPVKAIDTLYKARQIIRFVAHKHGLKATVYPRPYNFTCGSASHMHFSINGADAVEKYADPFLAGILQNFNAILAFTFPIEESFSRVQAGVWAGGEWVCWGTQNREVPIRKCGPGHWELKSVDGVGNMYLSMAALVACGLHGIRQNLKLTIKDNLEDASTLTDAKRKDLGITSRIFNRQAWCLKALEKNEILNEMLGEKLIALYVELKRYEADFLDAMDEKQRKTWLIARY